MGNFSWLALEEDFSISLVAVLILERGMDGG